MEITSYTNEIIDLELEEQELLQIFIKYLNENGSRLPIDKIGSVDVQSNLAGEYRVKLVITVDREPVKK